jgi:hypothetical protein
MEFEAPRESGLETGMTFEARNESGLEKPECDRGCESEFGSKSVWAGNRSDWLVLVLAWAAFLRLALSTWYECASGVPIAIGREPD